VYSVEDPNLFLHLPMGCWRDGGTGRLDFLHPLAAQDPSISWVRGPKFLDEVG
jgi:hypothetical protein